MLELPPLSLYVHVPWCIKKCPYCDFNSHEQSGELPEADYISALCSDLDSELDQVQGRQISSIFIGGGTPSLFGAESFATLLQHIDQRIGIADGAEITLEANPGTVEALRFRDYRLAGINRLSLGIQSFSADSLKRLGRIHDDEQARQAVAIARRAGFDNLNLDLMHGLPEQNTEQALFDLETALAFEPEHLSWYQLTIEPNTVFYRYTPALPDDEQIDGIQEQGKALLEQRGYLQYEVSAYARDGRESTHNLNYWQFGDYLGIGAGAHGKITNLVQGSIYRSRKKKQPTHYLQSDAARLAERSAISGDELPLEYLLNSLRLRAGFSAAQFEARTGLAFSTIGKRVDYLRERGLLDADPTHITTSERGYQLLNSVLEEFMA
jgi:oxygen-independent coproporphyrinogen-3 oxidase